MDYLSVYFSLSKCKPKMYLLFAVIRELIQGMCVLSTIVRLFRVDHRTLNINPKDYPPRNMKI